MLQESSIYRFVYMIFAYLGENWRESLIARFFRKYGLFFSNIFTSSAIIDFFKRDGIFNRGFSNSAVYRFVYGLINLPQRLLHPLYERAGQVLGESILFNGLLFLLRKLHLLVAGFIFIALVVKHDSWNNLYSTIAMVILLLLYIIRTAVEGKTGFNLNIFNVFLITFVVCVVLAEAFSIMPRGSLRFLAFYLTCFIMVLLFMVSIRTKKDMTEVLTIILTGMTIGGLYGIYQKYTGVAVNVSWIDTKLNQGVLSRVYAFFYNPNNFAEIIVMFIPFYMAAFFNVKSLYKKLIYLAMAVPPFAALLLTQTRSAWIAFAVAGLVYVFFKEKRLIPVFLLLGILSIPLLPQSIILRIRTITNPEDTSSETRLQLYQTILPILKDYWFTGLGLGNETLLRVSRNYFSFIDNSSIPSHSHNLYLQIWLETGIAGILSFLAFIGATVKRSIRTICRSKDSYVNNILISGLASLSGILVIGIVEYVWFYQRVMLFFWVVIGIMLAALCIKAGLQEEQDVAE